jgi:NAD(P) transhydrogenase
LDVHIYAAGDIIGFPALASTSMEQGRLAACHMFEIPFEHTSDLFPYGLVRREEVHLISVLRRNVDARAPRIPDLRIPSCTEVVLKTPQ